MRGALLRHLCSEQGNWQSIDRRQDIISFRLCLWVSLLILPQKILAKLSSPLGWSPFVADYFCYHPVSTNRWGVFSFTFLGFMASKIFVEFIGIGKELKIPIVRSRLR
jgi:hypothetical protein